MLRIDGSSSAECIIVRESYARVFGEFRLVRSGPCGIDMLVVCLDSRTGACADFKANGSTRSTVRSGRNAFFNLNVNTNLEAFLLTV